MGLVSFFNDLGLMAGVVVLLALAKARMIAPSNKDIMGALGWIDVRF